MSVVLKGVISTGDTFMEEFESWDPAEQRVQLDIDGQLTAFIKRENNFGNSTGVCSQMFCLAHLPQDFFVMKL